MDFKDTPEQAKFRKTCREWLEKNAKLKTGVEKNEFANIDFLCEAKLIMGCKQWHLGNPNKNQYQRKFEIIFDDIPKNSHILLTIGEIDCRINDGILKHKKKKSSKSKTEIDLGIAKIEIKNNTFSDLINKVKKKNMLKPYPDINRTPD